jgi:hypothetical protein
MGIVPAVRCGVPTGSKALFRTYLQEGWPGGYTKTHASPNVDCAPGIWQHRPADLRDLDSSCGTRLVPVEDRMLRGVCCIGPLRQIKSHRPSLPHPLFPIAQAPLPAASMPLYLAHRRRTPTAGITVSNIALSVRALAPPETHPYQPPSCAQTASPLVLDFIFSHLQRARVGAEGARR